MESRSQASQIKDADVRSKAHSDSHDHHSMTTPALLAILVFMPNFRKGKDDKEQCSQVLQQVLEKALSPDDCASLDLGRFSCDEASGACSIPPIDDGFCSCYNQAVREAKEKRNEGLARSPQQGVFRFLMHMFSHWGCKAVRACLQELVVLIAMCVDACPSEWGSYDILKDTDQHMVGIQGKRRRLNYEYVKAVADTSIARSKASAASEMVKVLEPESDAGDVGLHYEKNCVACLSCCQLDKLQR